MPSMPPVPSHPPEPGSPQLPSPRMPDRVRAALRPWPPSRAQVLVILAVAAAYFVTARLGLLFAMPGGHVTPVWPPSGLALAAMFIFGRRIWPGIWLGSFAANLWGFLHGSAPVPLAVSILVAAGIAAGGAATAWLGAELLRRFVGAGNPIERVRDVCAFMGLGGVIACLLSATNGVAWLCLGGFAPWSAYGPVWLTWWLGDTAGVFVFAPLLLAWCVPAAIPQRPRRVEAGVCFALLLAVSYSVFVGDPALAFSGRHFTFVIIPFLVWPALRFGQRGAATAALAVACLAVWGTIHGRGPFDLPTRNESLLVLELFLSVVSLTALCIAAVVSEQSHAEAGRQTVLDELESRVRERTAALVAEIAERKQQEALLSGQRQVLEMIASGVPLPETLTALLRVIEAQSPEMLCSVLLLDPDGTHLRHGAAPSLPEAFTRAIDGLGIGANSGSCGTAAFRREPVIVEDIATDPLWAEYRGLALAHGLRACWSTPIFDALRKVLGTFAIYYRQPGRPTSRHLRLIDIATQTAAIAIGREQTLAALRESEARLRLSVAASNIGLWDWNLATNEVYFSPEWKGQLGYADDEISNRLEEWESRVHPDDLAPTLALVRRFIGDPAAEYAVEFRLRHKDGSWRWIFTQGQIVRDAAGKPLRMVGCHMDITGRKLAETALHELSRRLLQAEDEERRRIAKELHDSTAQDLVAVILNLGLLRDALPPLAARPAQIIEDSVALIENSANDIRTLSYILHPPRLEEMGLPGGLAEYAAGLGRRADLRIRVEAAPDFGRLPEDLEIALFRVAQESLGNVVRHSESDAATIRLARTGARVVLEIQDFGHGMPPDMAEQAGARGVGIAGMRERLQHLGGRLEIESGSRGTTVRAVVPL